MAPSFRLKPWIYLEVLHHFDYTTCKYQLAVNYLWTGIFIFLYLIIAEFNYRQKVLIVTSSRYTPPNTSSDIVDCFSIEQLLLISAIRHLLMNSWTFFPWILSWADLSKLFLLYNNRSIDLFWFYSLCSNISIILHSKCINFHGYGMFRLLISLCSSLCTRQKIFQCHIDT